MMQKSGKSFGLAFIVIALLVSSVIPYSYAAGDGGINEEEKPNLQKKRRPLHAPISSQNDAKEWEKLWASFIVIALLVSSVIPYSYAAGDGGINEEEKPNLGKMRVKELRKILDARGVKSEGIMEKSDLVALAEESWDLPLVELKAADTKSEPDKKKDEELDDMLRKLQQQTGAGFQVFKKGDNIEDFIKNMGDKGDKEL
eukprot:CAMPEP_0114287198 /NCGR_PEP_ID=MMETSP0059-20121206/6153_1 /TAXON_ID=36894 /ORGANISM="Pyramimonas parkeae, Strain CCMP726" /LENGTH=199 /DNA_ID=CAMNT_0001408269 /DNA_START=63 /DNA_END=663 /DNA_ORIENTATION=+